MLRRFLYDEEGRIRVMRLVPLLGVTIALAFFGTLLVFVTPAVSDHSFWRGVWVLFAIFVLKLPLVLLLWWFIWRNKEWPGKRVRWSRKETHEILSYIEAEADRAQRLPDAGARLRYLAAEAWHVADTVEGPEKVDALTVALKLDQRCGATGPRGGG